MAGGWARDGAVQEQIDASVADAVASARARLQQGDSLEHCEDCDEPIPAGRRRALPGVRKCVHCQQAADDQQQPGHGINRRGSKDSQLR